MKKRMVRIISVLAAAALLAGPAGTMAFAAGAGADLTDNGKGTTYTEAGAEAGGGKVQFIKTLTMDEEAHVPNAEFSFTLSTPDPESGKAAVKNPDGTVLYTELYSGGDSSKVTGAPSFVNNSASFYSGASGSQEESTTAAAQTTGKKYASTEVEIDFSNVSFNEPGVYRWVITESASAESLTGKGITNDSDSTRILDVYVCDDGEGRLSVAGYILYNEAEDPQVPATEGEAMNALNETKPDGFDNTYETENLKIKKMVSGNQASRDEYFKMTVTLENMLPGEVCDVDLTGADTITSAQGINKTTHRNPVRITADEQGKATVVFWLMHNQELQINGLSKNTKYMVQEDAAQMDREGYVPSAEITGDTEGSVVTCTYRENGSTYQAADTGITKDSQVSFTNTKNGIIPTGILTAVLPGAAAVLAGAVGITLFARRKRSEDEIAS